MLVAVGATAPKLAVDARYLIVPRGLRLTAQHILYLALTYESGITNENMQRGTFGNVITYPEFSDPTDWAVIADPMVALAIYITDNQVTDVVHQRRDPRQGAALPQCDGGGSQTSV